MACDYGLRVVGAPSARRRLISMRAALRAYAAADDAACCDCESYLTALAYGAELRDAERESGRYRQYVGPIGPACGYLPVDLDAADDPLSAVRAAGRMVDLLADRYGIDPAHVLTFYSGAKGAHLLLPLRVASSVGWHRVARRFVEALAAEANDVTIDPAIYSSLALFRSPNSKHPRSGLHKVLLSRAELRLPLSRIQALAARPRPFDWPEPSGSSPHLMARWEQAQADVAAAQAQRAARVDRDARLTAATRRFIRRGAAAGDRHRLLFGAAANLGECGCPLDLAQALLLPAALDCWLPEAEAVRQIECGHAHGTATPQNPEGAN